MAQRRILIIDGHPDAYPAHFVHALASAYAKGAAGHDVKTVRIADLDFPVLRDPREWLEQPPPISILAVQKQMEWAEHLVILFPLWLGDMPALLKAFFEQVLRPEFAFRYGRGMMADKLLTGRSARVIVTMGMPGAIYEFFYFAHSMRSLERNILKFVGIAPVKRTVVGSVEANAGRRQRWLEKVEALGTAGT